MPLTYERALALNHIDYLLRSGRLEAADLLAHPAVQ
jgi:hypothetical protein